MDPVAEAIASTEPNATERRVKVTTALHPTGRMAAIDVPTDMTTTEALALVTFIAGGGLSQAIAGAAQAGPAPRILRPTLVLPRT